ncbi:MAG: SDR family oxidoreductase [Cyanobacteriota bacterium]|nr:SDR family oxidoreductase [Cyanobacteriota bacterium]
MPTALITGASSGIGEAFARVLAERKTDLVLVARSQDKLETLARELRDRHGLRVEVIVCDLSRPDAASQVFETVQTLGLTIDTLINNAGFGDYGSFTENSRAKQLDMIRLNVLSIADLTYQFLPSMQQRGFGEIINLSSIAGFLPMPYLAVYAATKAFVLSFSEALWGENRETGVRVLAVCPGPTQTQFFKVAGFNPFKNAKEAAKASASPEWVVQESLKALARGDSHLVVGGFSNHVITTLPRFLPRGMLVRVIEKQFRPQR